MEGIWPDCLLGGWLAEPKLAKPGPDCLLGGWLAEPKLAKPAKAGGPAWI
jgi:hypothetical protein